MPRIKITKANLNGIALPEAGQVDYLDTDLPGFRVRATKEALTYYVRATLRGTNQKPFVPIGRHGVFTPEQARAIAKEYLRRLDMGENPHPKHQPKFEIITVKDLYSQYINSRKSPLAVSTKYQYDSWMNNHFKDWLPVAANTITGTMVLERLTTMEKSNGKIQAQNAIKLLRGLFRFGIALHPGVIVFNPVEAVREIRGRDWQARTRRITCLTAETLPAWLKAVNEYHLPKGRDYMLLLLYTGLRRTEAASLKWSDIDFKAKTFTFAPEKKRGDRPEGGLVTMPMSKQLHKLLLDRRKVGWENEYVFPGKFPSPRISNPDNWKRDIIAASGITWTFHDLRRTFITIAESLDIPHYALKALLNHSMGNDVTGGYIIINAERLREPTQRVVDKIHEMAASVIKIDTNAQTAA